MTREGSAAAPAVGVRARGWGWRHPTRRAWAVRGLDLDIAPGERVMVLGASGAGKSTLLAGLAGLLGPGTEQQQPTGDEEGRLLLDGVPAAQARRRAVAAGAARTGLLLQDPLAQTVLARCGDDVAFGLENHAVPAARIWARVDEALAAVGFPYGRAHPTARLSGGQRQRLALAGVLALRPGLILLDEPTAMLDQDGAALLRDRIAGLLAETGMTCVLVEHRVAEWLELVDRVVVLEPGGGAVADGPADEVLRAQGPRLAATGVWVPGPAPIGPALTGPAPPGPAGGHPCGLGEVLLTARGLAAGRPGLPGVAGPGSRRRWIGRRGTDGRGAAAVVRDVELTLRAGEATWVLGPNGSGKSTLALVVGGLYPPVAGRLTASAALAGTAGPDPFRWRPRELVTRIGTVFQEPQHQFVAATVEQELHVGLRRAGVGEQVARDRVVHLLERLRLDRLARANPFTLSGGEQRRLSVATALATRPRVLVLDEPTFGQDARTWAELVRLLGEVIADGSAVLAATHDAGLVAALGGPVLRLRDGRPVASSSSASASPSASSSSASASSATDPAPGSPADPFARTGPVPPALETTAPR